MEEKSPKSQAPNKRRMYLPRFISESDSNQWPKVLVVNGFVRLDDDCPSYVHMVLDYHNQYAATAFVIYPNYRS